jgi:hypothetical protein
MSSLIAFLMAVLYVCLGYGLGVVMTRRGSKRGSTSNRILDAAALESAVPMTADEASTFLERIQQVTTNVDHDVDRHATRVAEISGELSAEGLCDSAGV